MCIEKNVHGFQDIIVPEQTTFNSNFPLTFQVPSCLIKLPMKIFFNYFSC